MWRNKVETGRNWHRASSLQPLFLMKNAHVRMHKNIEQMVFTDLLRRIQVRVPSIFCLAFSLELSIKAALVQQGDGFYQRDMINDEF